MLGLEVLLNAFLAPDTTLEICSSLACIAWPITQNCKMAGLKGKISHTGPTQAYLVACLAKVTDCDSGSKKTIACSARCDIPLLHMPSNLFITQSSSYASSDPSHDLLLILAQTILYSKTSPVAAVTYLSTRQTCTRATTSV